MLLKEDIDSFLEKTHLVSTLKMVKPHIAVLCGPDDKVIDPIITAQAADTALDLENVGASFAITRRSNDTIGISARSMGKINVQLIMEKLGGAGIFLMQQRRLKMLLLKRHVKNCLRQSTSMKKKMIKGEQI